MNSTDVQPSTLRSLQRRKREDAILAAAYDVFGRCGREQAKVEDIAALAQVSPPTVFNYFGDKDRLFIAAFQRELERQHEARLAWIRSWDGTSPFVMLEIYLADVMNGQFADGSVRHSKRQLWCDLYAATYAGAARSSIESGTADLVVTEDRRIAVELEQLFETCVARGLCRLRCSTRDLAELILAIGNLHWGRWLTSEIPPDELSVETQRQAALVATLLIEPSIHVAGSDSDVRQSL